MAQFPNTEQADGIWTLKKVRRAILGDNWPSAPILWTVDVSNLTYDSISFSAASEETSAFGVTFNSDGTKMYIVGFASDSVHQYSLSSAYDISTASYDSVSFSVATQLATPRSVRFNDDGTKMYVSSNAEIYQYSLSSAFDISTASYDSVSLNVSGEEAFTLGFCFSTDGTKMYIIGNNGDEVNQYSLSTAFDLSTASYDSVLLSISSQDTTPSGIAFNPQGTKMYIVGYASDSVHQYSLSSSFDLSTASYDSVSFSVQSQDSVPFDIAFSKDGTKMFMIGSSDTVYQYSTGL